MDKLSFCLGSVHVNICTYTAIAAMLAVMGAHFRAVKIIYWRVSVMDQMNQSLASLLPEGMQWLVGPLIALSLIHI